MGHSAEVVKSKILTKDENEIGAVLVGVSFWSTSSLLFGPVCLVAIAARGMVARGTPLVEGVRIWRCS